MAAILTNAQLAELLAVAALAERDQRQRALRRAAGIALAWPEEAEDLVAQGRSLTELRSVGPWVAKYLAAWLADPPALPDPPPLRSGFISYAAARRIVEAHPDWRDGLRGDLQMHTTYSDGSAPVETMADAAAALGHEYILLTDHSKGLPIAHGMDEAGFATQHAEIAVLNALLATSERPLRVLRGIEMNVSPAGAGDMDESFLGSLDLVLGAFHSQLRTKEDQTERYLRALDNPTVDVHAHPRGRIWNHRLGLFADWQRIAERAVELDKALEIDAYPDRQDLNIELLRIAATAGTRISIGTDAHHPDELAFIWIGVAAAIEAGIKRDRILNYLPADKVIDWARRRRSS